MLKLVKNRCYHVEGWKQGSQFRLLDWNETHATIQRPLSRGKKWQVPLGQLRNTKRYGAKKQPIKVTGQTAADSLQGTEPVEIAPATPERGISK